MRLYRDLIYEVLPEAIISYVAASLAVIKQLAFIEGDYIAEKKLMIFLIIPCYANLAGS